MTRACLFGARRVRQLFPIHLLLAASLVATTVSPAAATEPTEFQREKCERYARAFDDVVRRFGTKGVSEQFLAGHVRFIAGHCLSRADICPKGPAELNLANLLVMAGMNRGLASTFFPFACRKEGALAPSNNSTLDN